MANPAAILPILGQPEPPALKGIAKLAAAGDHIADGHQVEFFNIPVKSLLNRVVSRRKLPFTWGINPYRGCEFACKYCYARYTHEFMEKPPEAFEQQIYVKEHAGWLLRQELKKVKPNEGIAIGTATDPYQPAERKFQVTREILETFAEFSGLELGLITKSQLIVRDIDVLTELNRRHRLVVNITVTTTDVELARKLEPRAPRPDLRLQALAKLREAGIPAGIFCAPVLPEITDAPKQLEAVVKAAADHGAQFVMANPLFLKPCSITVFLPFVEQHFPHLIDLYKDRYTDRAFATRAYQNRVRELVTKYRAKYGIAARTEYVELRKAKESAATSLQMPLF